MRGVRLTAPIFSESDLHYVFAECSVAQCKLVIDQITVIDRAIDERCRSCVNSHSVGRRMGRRGTSRSLLPKAMTPTLTKREKAISVELGDAARTVDSRVAAACTRAGDSTRAMLNARLIRQ